MEYRIKTIEKNPDKQVVSLDSIVTIEDDYGESVYSYLVIIRPSASIVSLLAIS